MNKRIYGLLPNPNMRAMPRDRHPAEHGRKRSAKAGKLIGCSKCGRNGCTLYGSGERKLCKECGGRRG